VLQTAPSKLHHIREFASSKLMKKITDVGKSKKIQRKWKKQLTQDVFFLVPILGKSPPFLSGLKGVIKIALLGGGSFGHFYPEQYVRWVICSISAMRFK